MLQTVQHCWPAWARFVFNGYRHRAQRILRHPGELPVTTMCLEGLTQGDPLCMVLYSINLVPLAKELRASELRILSPLYSDNMAFNGLARWSAYVLKMLIERVTDQGYFFKPAKLLLISDTPGQEEETWKEFAAEGLVLKFVSGSRYLGAYLVTQEEFEVWVKPQVEAWAHGVRVLYEIYRKHPQSVYDRLRMLLQLNWQYL